MSETGGEQAGSEEKRGWFGRLKAGLSRSAGQLGSSIGALFTKRRLDQDAPDELEETLIQADLGIRTAGKIVSAIATDRFEQDLTAAEISADPAQPGAAMSPQVEPPLGREAK